MWKFYDIECNIRGEIIKKKSNIDDFRDFEPKLAVILRQKKCVMREIMPKHIKIDISMYNLHNMKVSSDKSQHWARSNQKNAKNRVFLVFPV